jgi:RNA polymerase sigma-70 factor (ECF subfamily)
MITDDTSVSGAPDGFFHTTHWSVVLSARGGETSQADRALEALCRLYWYPLYAFVRRRGFTVADAQDLTQEFFSRLLRRDFLAQVAREKGKFRSFLLVALKNFLSSEWRRGQTAKRGGGHAFVSWEELNAEDRYAHEPVSDVTPEHLYEQRWALAVMNQALERLGAEFAAAGKQELFEQLKGYLSTEGSKIDYSNVAKLLGLSAGSVPVAVHRLRRRYGELIRSVVAHTVAAPDDVEREVRFLAQSLE